jgi:hypothetical protein
VSLAVFRSLRVPVRFRLHTVYNFIYKVKFSRYWPKQALGDSEG